jgi:hypothetical protein
LNRRAIGILAEAWPTMLSDANRNLTTIGEDQPPLQSTAGYDDVTGLDAATASFVTAFPKRS